MDLITALKSKRRFRRVADEQGKQDPTWQVNPAPSPNSPVWSDNDLLADYEIEPEPPQPIVFECEWSAWGANGPVYPHDDGTGFSFKSLLGRRTKVTIEVID